MLSLTTIYSFFASAVLLALIPGPDNIFVLTQSISSGRKAGVFVALGLSTGLLFHTTAVALGVAQLFQTSPMAFTCLRLIGAAYLLYLAWRAFKSASTTAEISVDQKIISSQKLYLRGVIMNITNPKVTLFFLAFLPQFIEPKNGSISLQIISLGLIFISATIFVFSSVALAAGRVGKALSKYPEAMIKIDRASGVIFTGLALKLLLT